MSYTEAVELLQKSGQKFDYPVGGIDQQTEHERYLTEQIFQKPVFVTDYPRRSSRDEFAFYMRLQRRRKDRGRGGLPAAPGIGEHRRQREERGWSCWRAASGSWA